MNENKKTRISKYINKTVIVYVIISIIFAIILSIILMYHFLAQHEHIHNKVIAASIAKNVEEYLKKPINTLFLFSNLDSKAFFKTEKEKIEYFDAILEESELIKDLNVLSNEGLVTISSTESFYQKGFDLSNEEFIQTNNIDGKVFISDSYVSNTDNKASISISLYKNNKYYLCQIDLEKLRNMVLDFSNLQVRSIAGITDKNGVYIAHTDLKKVLERENDPNYYSLVKDNEMSIAKLNGDKYVVSTVFSEKYKWGVIIYTQETVIIKPIINLVIIFILLSIVFVIIEIYLLKRKNQKLELSFDKLVTNLEKMSIGDYFSNISLEAEEYYEFIKIDRSFNNMQQNVMMREEEIIALNENLENIVQLRTKELSESLDSLRLTQKALVQTEKMASLGQLVAGVAHEINTPVGIGVTLSTYLLDNFEKFSLHCESGKVKKSELDELIASSVESSKLIYDNLNRVAEIVSSFKKVASDVSFEDNIPFDLIQLINGLIISLKTQIKNRDIKIDFIHNEDKINMYSNPGAISQIITNLVVNTFIHGFRNVKNGVVTIITNVENDKIDIIVKDNGNGIEKSIIDKIFDPFFTTNRADGGTGLGLHIVYNIVQSLEGNVEVSSNVGKGTVFKIKIKKDMV
jgi:signal transduction histidine kinase